MVNAETTQLLLGPRFEKTEAATKSYIDTLRNRST